MHISHHIFTFILNKILLITAFLCISRSMAWSEEKSQNFHLFEDFQNLEEAQDFEVQSTISGCKKPQTNMLYRYKCAAKGSILRRGARDYRTTAETWSGSCFRDRTVEPRVDFRRVAPSCLPKPPFAIYTVLLKQN